MGFFMVLIPIGVFVVAFLFIASVAFSSFKKAKKTTDKVIPVIEQRLNEHLSKISTDTTPKPVERVCEYCGSTIANGANKCDSCGAKAKK